MLATKTTGIVSPSWASASRLPQLANKVLPVKQKPYIRPTSFTLEENGDTSVFCLQSRCRYPFLFNPCNLFSESDFRLQVFLLEWKINNKIYHCFKCINKWQWKCWIWSCRKGNAFVKNKRPQRKISTESLNQPRIEMARVSPISQQKITDSGDTKQVRDKSWKTLRTSFFLIFMASNSGQGQE